MVQLISNTWCGFTILLFLGAVAYCSTQSNLTFVERVIFSHTTFMIEVTSKMAESYF